LGPFSQFGSDRIYFGTFHVLNFWVCILDSIDASDSFLCNRPLLGEAFALSLLLFCFSGSDMRAQQPSLSLNDYFKQARDLENKQDFQGAERVYIAASTALPNQPEILKRLGIVYQTEFKFPESIATFERILQQFPEYPETNFFLGYSYFGQNQFDKAIEMFQKELAANPKYRRAHYYSGLAFESLNRIGDAIREFEILVKEDPNDTKVLYQLARIHKASSLTAIKQLSHVAPDSVFFHVLRAESYMEDEKYPEAIKEYKTRVGNGSKFSRRSSGAWPDLLQAGESD